MSDEYGEEYLEDGKLKEELKKIEENIKKYKKVDKEFQKLLSRMNSLEEEFSNSSYEIKSFIGETKLNLNFCQASASKALINSIRKVKMIEVLRRALERKLTDRDINFLDNCEVMESLKDVCCECEVDFYDIVNYLISIRDKGAWNFYKPIRLLPW